jgi:hypothetical protein
MAASFGALAPAQERLAAVGKTLETRCLLHCGFAGILPMRADEAR